MQTVYDKSGNQSSLLNVKVIETNLAIKDDIIDDIFYPAKMIYATAKTTGNQLYYGIVPGHYSGVFNSDTNGGLGIQLVGNRFTYNSNSAEDSTIKIDRIVVFY